jgi:hypothetical protein
MAIAIILVLAIVFVVFQNWKSVLTGYFLSRLFFFFGVLCGLFGIFTQYGLTAQLGSETLFADPTFYILLGALSMLAGIYWNTDKTNRIL